jgi:diadenosine tetraphosphate (Ap4A) HIT family hydrolase
MTPRFDGHIVVLPRKHVGTVYELEIAEQKGVWALVDDARGRLLNGLLPDAFDIGFDAGVYAPCIWSRAARATGSGRLRGRTWWTI